MKNKVVRVAPLPNGWLHVELADGRIGQFDVKPFMLSDFFSALHDVTYFNQVELFFGGVSWPNGQDLGPDTIAAFVQTVDTVVA